MKKNIYLLFVLSVLLFTSLNLFSQVKKETQFYLNSQPVDWNKVYLNPERIDSINVDASLDYKRAFIYTKDSVFSYASLSEILRKYTGFNDSADSLLFRINKKIIKDTVSIKIDDSYFIYVNVESLKDVSYLPESVRNLRIVNIDLESEKRKPQIRIRGHKDLFEMSHAN